MSDTVHIHPTEPLSPEELEEKRAEKLRNRRYFVVSFTDKKVPEGKPYRCWECGGFVTTIFAEPREQREVEEPASDIYSDEKVGGLCRKGNILFLFVWYGHD